MPKEQLSALSGLIVVSLQLRTTKMAPEMLLVDTISIISLQRQICVPR
jgi:hypothetical protein